MTELAAAGAKDSRQRRAIWLGAALLVAVALARITATYAVFCQTYDEPAHLSAGLEWLDQGTYVSFPHNPPLARVAFALLPWLDGSRYQPASSPVISGNATLYATDYMRTLTLARIGNLPFFLIAAFVVLAWGFRCGGARVALIALLLFTMNPVILGNAGLATNDLACAATVGLAVLALVYWFERPSILMAVPAGLALAAAVLTKFFAFEFIPAAILAIAVVAWRGGALEGARVRRAAQTLPLVFGIAFLSIWGGYRFSTLEPEHVTQLVLADSPLLPLLKLYARTGLPVPAPELIAGVGMGAAANVHNSYPNYLLGDRRLSAHTMFFPVMLATKTPIGLLALVAAAIPLALAAFRRRDAKGAAPAAVALALLLCGFTMHVEGGIRYLLSIYLPLSVLGALAADSLWRSGVLVRRIGGGTAVLALAIASFTAHPDYFPFFNLFAGRHPEFVSIDADLDWGQDLLRAADVLDSAGIHDVSVAYFGTAIPSRHLRARAVPLPSGIHRRGWIVISESYRQPLWTDGYLWLRGYRPVARIGTSMWLYHVE